MVKKTSTGFRNDIELIVLKEYCIPGTMSKLYLHEVETKLTCYKSDIRTIEQYLKEEKFIQIDDKKAIVRLYNDDNVYLVKYPYKKLQKEIHKYKQEGNKIGF